MEAKNEKQKNSKNETRNWTSSPALIREEFMRGYDSWIQWHKNSYMKLRTLLGIKDVIRT